MLTKQLPLDILSVLLSTPIEPEVIKDILRVASRAPSGTNTQPWKVYVVTGHKRDEMVERVCAAQIEVSKSRTCRAI